MGVALPRDSQPVGRGAHRGRVRLAVALLATWFGAIGWADCLAQAQAGPAPAKASEPTFAVQGFRIEGENPIGDSAAQAVLRGFVGPALSLERLEAAATRLERAIHEAGYGFYRIIVPPQEAGAIITLKVLVFTVDRIVVKGNEYFSEPNIRASLPALKEGGSPNTLSLARDLALANENPAKRMLTAFRAGEKPDTVDANVEVTESAAVSGFTQLSNTGTAATGISRLTFGASHANLFDRDHQITATYTVSPEQLSKVRQWGMFYRAPIYGWGGMVSAYVTDSNVQSGSAAGVAITGGGRFGGIQYTQYFAPRGDYRDYFTVSLDDKQFNNNITIAGLAPGANPNTCARIGSRPLTGSYSGRYEGADLSISFNGDYARNLPGSSRNGQSDYDQCNPPADPSQNLSAAWSVLRFGGDFAARFAEDWQVAARLRTQFSGQALIPGEKFGVGGAQSVRALGERALAGDGGVQASVEVYLPQASSGPRWLAFYDYGRVKNLQPVLPQNSYESVGSAGFGLRWQYRGSLALQMDFAQVIQGHAPSGNTFNVQNTRGHNRLHFNAILKF